MNDGKHEEYNTNSHTKFITAMLKSGLCYYSEVHILVKGTVTIVRQVVFKNCAPFTDCINQINGTQVDIAKDLDVAMPMYNLIECTGNYEKPSRSLWQYRKDGRNDNTTKSESFKCKPRLTYNTVKAGIAKVEISVPLE